MPPIVNSNETRLTSKTKNIFIDVTGVDLNKCNIVLNTISVMFSEYCGEKFSVEPVEIVSSYDQSSTITPNLNERAVKTNRTYLNKLASTSLDMKTITTCLEKMALRCEVLSEEELLVQVPIFRSDIMHPCDIAEDLAISFGYNNIQKKSLITLCHGSQTPINKLTELIRIEFSNSEFIECLTFSLLSKKDNFHNLNIKEYDCVEITGSKTPEFEVFRSSLMPGLFKTIESNRDLKVILIHTASFQDLRDL